MVTPHDISQPELILPSHEKWYSILSLHTVRRVCRGPLLYNILFFFFKFIGPYGLVGHTTWQIFIINKAVLLKNKFLFKKCNYFNKACFFIMISGQFCPLDIFDVMPLINMKINFNTKKIKRMFIIEEVYSSNNIYELNFLIYFWIHWWDVNLSIE